MNDRMSIFVCPVCQLPLQIQTKNYQCAAGHSFDIAREGYVNLLLANQKRSSEPGDNAKMIQNRRVFLEAGYFAPLHSRIVETLIAYIELEDERTVTVLDVGCGEGYYLGGLQQQFRLQPLQFAGLDVSKFAIKAAARKYSSVEFAVAGAHHLPVGDTSVDYSLSIFAPRSWSEFERVLKPDGKLLVIGPGKQHLWNLKRMLYVEPRPYHADFDTPPGFALHYASQLEYDLLLPDQSAIQQLLHMTPYFWHLSSEAQESLRQIESMETRVDFQLCVFEKSA